jgi:16S rRNA (cytosine967-C5)-methyltransferase
MKVSPARRAAFEILRRVEEEGAYSSALLAATDHELNPKDRALSHELVLGVLRNQLWLDRTIEHFAAREVEKLDLPVVLALRLGIYQLRFLTRIPESAAVNESVNLVKAARVKSAVPFANAVLRGITREPNYDPSSKAVDETEKLAIETSHPRWLIERWISQFGMDEAAALARANNEPAVLAFRFTSKVFRDSSEKINRELRAGGAEVIESKIAPGAWRVIQRKSTGKDAGDPQARPPQRGCRAGDPGSMPVIQAGEPHAGMGALQKLAAGGLIYFQDEASQLVAHLVGAQDRDCVLDVCGAPGSKSTLIALLAPSATIIAGDLYEHRARTIEEFAKQQGANNVRVIIHDATRELPFPPASFDRVLVDAPCSGTGTLRHNPEIRWRLNESDITQLAEKQKQILKHAAAVVRVAGRLVYSTCSMERDENEAVISDFLKENRTFARVKFDVAAGLITEDGGARTWPHRDDVEGFFVAALRRAG